jgi:hypothetical protein
MDIGGWLRGLGLGQYEAMFRESEIDAEVLTELTESDLSQLGVPLGHRKRLLKAIAALGVAETAPASASRPLREDAVPHGGERRQLTVMFCDLVGSLVPKYDDIIIDVGGRDTGSLRAALTVADLVLVPVQPRSFDVWALDQVATLVMEDQYGPPCPGLPQCRRRTGAGQCRGAGGVA